MDYRVDLYDALGRRTASFDEAPLLRCEAWMPGGRLRIEGVAPPGFGLMAPGWEIEVSLGGVPLARAPVRRVRACRGDARRFILDKYVSFRDAMLFTAETAPVWPLAYGEFVNERIDTIVSGLLAQAGWSADGIEECPVVLERFAPEGPLDAALTLLAYAAGGYLWGMDADGVVRFRDTRRADLVCFLDLARTTMVVGAELEGCVNHLTLEGPPKEDESVALSHEASIAAYGEQAARVRCHSLSGRRDIERLGHGILNDLAHPCLTGEVVWTRDAPRPVPGMLLEVRGMETRVSWLADAWDGRFNGRTTGRISWTRHEFMGPRVVVSAGLTSPMRSVLEPLGVLNGLGGAPAQGFRFMLDVVGVGLDEGRHVD